MGNQKTQAARLPILSASFGGNGSTHWFGQVITNSPQHHLQSPCRAMKLLLLVLLCVMAASCKRGGRGRRGPRECGAGGPQPTCSERRGRGRGGDRRGRGGRWTCSDGEPTKCPRENVICCDGSSPLLDRNRDTPPCTDGSRPKCSQDHCSWNNPVSRNNYIAFICCLNM